MRLPRPAGAAARSPRATPLPPPENRRPTGGLSSIPHRREMPVTANAGKCAPVPVRAIPENRPRRGSKSPGGEVRLSPAQTKPVFASKDGRLFRGGEARSPLRRDAAALRDRHRGPGGRVIGVVTFVFDLTRPRIEGLSSPGRTRSERIPKSADTVVRREFPYLLRRVCARRRRARDSPRSWGFTRIVANGRTT